MWNTLYTQFGTPYVEHFVYVVWHTLCGTLCIHSLAHLMQNTLYKQFGTPYVEHFVYTVWHNLCGTLCIHSVGNKITFCTG